MEVLLSELIGAIAQVLLFALIPFVWWFITARKKENFFRWIGLKRPEGKGNPVRLLLLTAAVMAAYALGTGFLIQQYSGQITSAGSAFAGRGLSYIPAAVAYGFLRTGLSEELLFRGFLLKRIGGKFGFVCGNTVQALLFGLLHGVPFGLATHSVSVAMLLTLLPGLLGFYQGWLNEKKCSGSILPSWLIHGLMNTVVAVMSL